ncbi:MAG: F0F1 ATP synthase subunit B [Bacteroidetes bacterium]|nr:F0F1 ATP synthase subunit B [Bacteroidota bacterium]
MPGLDNIGMLAMSGGLLDVSPGLMIWTVLTFLVLMLILRKVAWKPMLLALNEREQFIKDSLDKAEQAQRESERLAEVNKALMEKSEVEAQEIIAQGREYSEKLKSQMLEESREEARKMINSAKDEIVRKNQEAFSSLKSQVVNIAVLAAEKIIKENLDNEKQEKLVNRFIDDLTKN